jgi:hypothetical protein
MPEMPESNLALQPAECPIHLVIGSYMGHSSGSADAASDALVLSHGKLALATDDGVYTAREGRGSDTKPKCRAERLS